MLNLIGNVIKFMDVGIVCVLVCEWCGNEYDMVEVLVLDMGIGIVELVILMIFELY